MSATTQLSPKRRLVKCTMGHPHNRMEGMCVLCSDSHSSEKNEVTKEITEQGVRPTRLSVSGVGEAIHLYLHNNR